MIARKHIAAALIGAATLAITPLVLAADGQPKQSAGEYASDAVVTTKVKAALVAEKELSALDISVETIEGVTTLTGDVETSAHKDLAGRVTGGVDGVRQVNNDLKVKK